MIIRTLVAFTLLATGTAACTESGLETDSTSQESLSYSKFSTYIFCGPAYDRNADHELIFTGADDTFAASNSNCAYPPGAGWPCEGICNSFSVAKGWGSLTQQQLNTAYCQPVTVNNQTTYGYCVFKP